MSDLRSTMQAYYDRTERGAVKNSGALALDTYDLDLQHSFALGVRNSIVDRMARHGGSAQAGGA